MIATCAIAEIVPAMKAKNGHFSTPLENRFRNEESITWTRSMPSLSDEEEMYLLQCEELENQAIHHQKTDEEATCTCT